MLALLLTAKPVEAADTILVPGTILYMGASDSPDAVLITRVSGEADSYGGTIFAYREYPYQGPDRRGGFIEQSLIAVGTKTQVKRLSAFKAQYGEVHGGPVPGWLGSEIARMTKFLAGETVPAAATVAEVVDDHRAVRFSIIATRPASEYPRDDPWNAAESFGGVGSLEVDGATRYEVHGRNEGFKRALLDTRFKVVAGPDYGSAA